jgi:hypothetical protein
MNFFRAVVDISVGINVLVKGSASEPTIDHLNRANLDNAMPAHNLEPGGLRI